MVADPEAVEARSARPRSPSRRSRARRAARSPACGTAPAPGTANIGRQKPKRIARILGRRSCRVSSPARKRAISSTIRSTKRGPQAAVTPAMCGVRNTLGIARTGLSAGTGSGSNTSRQATMSPRPSRAISASGSHDRAARDVDEHRRPAAAARARARRSCRAFPASAARGTPRHPRATSPRPARSA